MKKVFVLAAAASILAASSVNADLVITEVVEGTTGNFKYVEILNTGAVSVDLTSPQISVRRYSNGGSSPTAINLTGTLAAGAFYVVANNVTDYQNVFGGSANASLYNNNISHNGDDSYDLYDGTTVLDSFGGDWIGAGDPGSPAADGAYFRVGSAMPNNGNWGGTSETPIADGTTSPSGAWHRVAMTASNGNAATICTPLAGGGASGVELPVELDSFQID